MLFVCRVLASWKEKERKKREKPPGRKRRRRCGKEIGTGNRAGIFVVTGPVRWFARSLACGVVVATQLQMRVARSFSL